MSVLNNGINLLLAADAAASSGYQISRSLRFNNPADSAYLGRTPAAAGNRTTWTWSGWVKRSGLGAVYQNILSAANSSNDRYEFYFTSSNELSGEIRIGGTGYAITTTSLYRDPSAWYHLVVVMDTTQATAANRHKIYINGTQVTNFSSASYPPQNSTPQFNAADPHSIGRYQNGAAQYFDGYLADVYFIDGQALTPTSFTTTDSNGELQPIAYTGNYGLVTVTAATGALPIFNTTGDYGTVKGSGTRTDTNSAYISLALPMDGSIGGTSFGDQSATIKGSGSAKTVTVTNATTSITQSKFYGSSGFFNNTAYLRVPYSSDIDLASIDFTVETFVYKTTSDEDQIVDFRGNGATGWAMYIKTDGTIQIYDTNAGSQVGTSSGAVPLNTWAHIALTRNGTGSNNCTFWINGVNAGTFTYSNFAATNSGGLGIACDSSNGANLTGYLQDLRIYKGIAKYTSAFSPVAGPNNSFHLPFSNNATAAALGTDTSGSAAPTVANGTGGLPIFNTTDTYGTVKGSGTRTDTNSASIVLALPMDGTNGGTSFGDQSAVIKGSGSAKTITVNGVTTSTVQNKFYGSSGYFDGASKLTLDLSTVSLASAYTVEFWWYKNGTQSGNHGHFCLNSANNQSIAYREAAATGTGFNDFYIDLGGTSVTGLITQTINTGFWNHFAFVHEGSGVFKSYLNGVLQTTKTVGTTGTMGSTTSIGGGVGAYTGQFVNGYICDHRIYQAAKYTSNFNPPASPNNWTVNNFSVFQGNGNYVSSQFSGDVRSLTDAYGPRNMFNGIIGSDSVSGAVCYAPYSSNSTCTWTSTTTITGISSLRIYASLSGTTGKLTVNGTDYSSLVTALSGGYGYITIPQSSLSSIAFGYTGGLNSATGVAAVEVNGVILLDNFSNSGNDSLVDSPTSYGTPDTGVGNEVRGNYSTLNPLFSGTTLTNGNLDAEGPSNNWFIGRGTIAFPDSAKWYFEATITGTASASYAISVATAAAANSVGDVTTATGIYGIVNNTSTTITKFINGTASTISTAAAWAQGDILMCAYDGATSKVWFGRNGTWYPPTNGGSAGNPGAGTNETMTASGTVFPAVHCYGTSADMAVNFGQRAFVYTAPTDFKALVDTNLPTPTIAKGNTVFDATLYTGTGTTNSITSLQFAPDLVWLKARSSAQDHQLFDIVRGPSSNLYALQSNSAGAEGQYGTMGSLDSTGFTLTGAGGATNANGTSYVAWTWDGGTSTVTNTAGSITSQVRANASAGFSVVTYTGTGSNATVGHGLNVAPRFIIVKSRSISPSDWKVYHVSTGPTQRLNLNTTDAAAANSTVWNDTAPTSSVFSIGTNSDVGQSSATYVSYCFAPVTGYSSFGSYVGNGSSDGPFIHTGFKPRCLVVKRTDSAIEWKILDTARSSTGNVVDDILYPDLYNAEGSNDSNHAYDFLSNGFKLRTTHSSSNASGGTYIYAAWAENPFQYARAR